MLQVGYYPDGLVRDPMQTGCRQALSHRAFPVRDIEQSAPPAGGAPGDAARDAARVATLGWKIQSFAVELLALPRLALTSLIAPISESTSWACCLSR